MPNLPNCLVDLENLKDNMTEADFYSQIPSLLKDSIQKYEPMKIPNFASKNSSKIPRNYSRTIPLNLTHGWSMHEKNRPQ